MRAIVYDRYGAPDVLRLAEASTPAPAPGEVLVRIRAIGVNPADVKWRQGMFDSFAPLGFPHIPGYDIAGTVEATVGDAGGLTVGDRVFGMIPKGACAEYAALPVSHAARVPDTLDFARAAALPTPGLTGVQMIEDHLQPKAGQTVLISGAVGGVGRFALFAARQAGARTVAAVRASQTDEALALGADQVIVLGAEDWSGAPFDHVADTVGGEDVARLCRRLAPGGLIRTASTTPISPEGLTSDPVFIVIRNDVPRLEQLANGIADGVLPVTIARRMPLSATAEAHCLMEAGGVGGKLILEP